VPGAPRTAKPPRALVDLVERLSRDGSLSTGLTTTETGEWALLVRVPAGVATPLPEVEREAAGLPVVYEPIDRLPVARPAFPGRGE
jgi:hypothetical protein